MPLVRRATKPIPSSGSRTESFEANDYSLGMDTFTSNDKFSLKSGSSNKLRMAKNARIITLGEYENRKGADYYSDAAGETKDDSQEATTGASEVDFSDTIRIAQPFTTSSAGILSKVDINIKNDSSGVGVPIVEIYTDSSSEPGTLLAKSSINPTDVTSSLQYLSVRFPEAPELSTSTTYWIVIYVQAVASGAYTLSNTTDDTNALISTDSGSSWSSTSYDINFKQYYATAGGVKGLIRAYKSDGTKVTLFAHGTTLYSVDDNDGSLTAVKTGLNSGATHYRFVLVNDIVYYVNEYDGLRKWDFTTESQVNSNNYSNIAVHKGLLFLVEKDDPNKVVYSNFADYETFTSTDFLYIPSPKTGDPVKAMRSLNGYMIFWTMDNKFILSGDDNATFALDEAPDQKGTYTQETTAQDKHFVYYLSEDGVYRSNGSEAQLMSKNNYKDIKEIADKSTACIVINRGRLYLWYSEENVAYNNQAWVWNLNYGSSDGDCVESFDTNTCIQRAVDAFRDDDKLITACSILGRVYWQEQDSNDYSNLGGDIEFELQTHYLSFSSPAVLKEIRYWNPRFAAQSSSYAINCEYAVDLRDNWMLYGNPNVQGSGATYGSGFEYGDGTTYGTSAEFQSQLYVPGEYRRIAIRYKHYATRQPQKFLGHSLVVQTRRIR